MTTMKAALYQGDRKLKVRDIPKPALGPGQVTVKVRAEGVCGSDLLLWWDKKEPEERPAGHEVSGEIVEVGKGVSKDRIGEHVAIDILGMGLNCNVCWYCRQGQTIHCTNKKPDTGGGYAEYIVRNSSGCFTIPKSLSWEECGLAEPLAVSVHAVRRGRMKPGETVLVLGAGNIGLTSVAAARAMGAGKVIVTARHPHQADMAKKVGADVVLPDKGKELEDGIADATDGRGADVILESVGGRTDATIQQSIKFARKQGRIVILGGFWVPITVDWLQPLMKEHSIIFSSCYGVLDARDDFEVAIDLMADKRVNIKPMVTHKFGLDDIQKAVDTAYDKTSGSIKVQIHMS
ncbi:MAG: zinc-binding dehydrogenase [Chloroflexi bacterium]|nr:zinc-binding dehydrogenase [Chloroflexota bacterium]